jgi:hypothetical protein
MTTLALNALPFKLFEFSLPKTLSSHLKVMQHDDFQASECMNSDE